MEKLNQKMSKIPPLIVCTSPFITKQLSREKIEKMLRKRLLSFRTFSGLKILG